MTPRQKSILNIIKDNPSISMVEIADKISVSISTIEREIPKMTHILRHIGPKKGGHWEIIK